MPNSVAKSVESVLVSPRDHVALTKSSGLSQLLEAATTSSDDVVSVTFLCARTDTTLATLVLLFENGALVTYEVSLAHRPLRRGLAPRAAWRALGEICEICEELDKLLVRN